MRINKTAKRIPVHENAEIGVNDRIIIEPNTLTLIHTTPATQKTSMFAFLLFPCLLIFTKVNYCYGDMFTFTEPRLSCFFV